MGLAFVRCTRLYAADNRERCLHLHARWWRPNRVFEIIYVYGDQQEFVPITDEGIGTRLALAATHEQTMAVIRAARAAAHP